MMAALLPFRTKIAVLVMVALLGALAVQSLRLDGARLRLEAAQSEIKGLQASIEAQNAGIRALAIEAEARQKAAQRAAKAAQEALARATQRADAIEASATPQSCQAAIDFLVEDARTPQ